jgi:hypothetical protein
MAIISQPTIEVGSHPQSGGLFRGTRMVTRIVRPVVATTTPSVYLVQEDFEAPGFQDPNWVSTGSTVTPNYDWVSAGLLGLQGTYALRTQSAAGQPRAYVTFTDQGEVYVFFEFYEAPGSDSGRIIAAISDSLDNDLITIERQNGTNIFIMRSAVGSTQTTDGAFVAGTTYYIWLHYKAGAGTALATFGISTNTTEPTSGTTNFCTVTGTSVLSAGRFRCGQIGGNGIMDYVYDKVRVKTTSIGNNPA